MDFDLRLRGNYHVALRWLSGVTAVLDSKWIPSGMKLCTVAFLDGPYLTDDEQSWLEVYLDLCSSEECPEIPSEDRPDEDTAREIPFVFGFYAQDEYIDQFHLKVHYNEEVEKLKPVCRDLLLGYLSQIAEEWPDSRASLGAQVIAALGVPLPLVTSPNATPQLAETSAGAPSLSTSPNPDVSDKKASFSTEAMRTRADLFKEIKQSHPDATYREVASMAEETAKQRLEAEIAAQFGALGAAQRELQARDRMREIYGKEDFTLDDVRNAWKKMRGAGEVGPWETGVRGP